MLFYKFSFPLHFPICIIIARWQLNSDTIKLHPVILLPNYTVKKKSAESYFTSGGWGWLWRSWFFALYLCLNFMFWRGPWMHLSHSWHTLPPSHAYFLYPSHTGGMKTDWLGLEQEKIQNDHHSERRKGISNQEREGDTMEMESRSLESDILSFQIIRVKRV